MRAQGKLGKAKSKKETKHELVEIRKEMEEKNNPPPMEKVLLSLLLCATLCTYYVVLPNYVQGKLDSVHVGVFLINHHHLL